MIRWSGVHDDGSEARRSCSPAGARPRRRWRGSTSSPPPSGPATTPSSACGLYEYRAAALAARAGETEDGDGYEHRSRKYQKMVRSVLDAQRRAVVELRNRGEISNDVMHRIERELDLEDERLEI